jgi:NADP-dependent 3-hydroxy acid dehydrogenase YdfG
MEFGYGISKGAFHRIARVLATELLDTEVKVFDVQPRKIATERIAQDLAAFGITNVSAPPNVVATVVMWS